MVIFDKLAEQYIQDAIASGDLDNPEWYGKPLPEDDLSMVPEELRMGYRILKNSGFIPPELETINDINRLEYEINRDKDPGTSKQTINRLTCLYMRLEKCVCGGNVNLALRNQYYNKLVNRFETGGQDR